MKRHLNDVSLPGRWWLNIEYELSSFVIFQGIRTSIAKKPYNFVILQAGVGGRPASAHSIASTQIFVQSIFPSFIDYLCVNGI